MTDTKVTNNSEQQNPADRTSIVQIIENTPPQKIAELNFVKDRFIKNYNLCNRGNLGDLMYHRQLVHFNQLISSSDRLQGVDGFSLYACFITAAVKGYSFDPEDNEIYLVPMDGKAKLLRQAGAHVRRLKQTKQVNFVEQVKFVYKDDVFKVKNGRVVDHEEMFKSEELIAAYVRFVLDDAGTDRFFIYRKSDWLDWKKKSKQAQGPNWNSDGNGTPAPGFLRTKIVLHACKEKVWAIGTTPAEASVFDVEIEDDDIDQFDTPTPSQLKTTPTKSEQKPEDEKSAISEAEIITEEPRDDAKKSIDAF